MKKIVWISVITGLLMAAGAIFGLRQLTYAQMPDLRQAAETALNHSALNQIQTAKQYTGGPKTYVFFGEDKLGRKVMVFATQKAVLGMEYLAKGLTEQQIKEKAQQTVGFQQISSVTPGIVDPTGEGPIRSEQKYLWEVYGTTVNGDKQYAYFDFYKGTLLWNYELKQPK